MARRERSSYRRAVDPRARALADARSCVCVRRCFADDDVGRARLRGRDAANRLDDRLGDLLADGGVAAGFRKPPNFCMLDVARPAATLTTHVIWTKGIMQESCAGAGAGTYEHQSACTCVNDGSAWLHRELYRAQPKRPKSLISSRRRGQQLRPGVRRRTPWRCARPRPAGCPTCWASRSAARRRRA